MKILRVLKQVAEKKSRDKAYCKTNRQFNIVRNKAYNEVLDY